MLSSALVLCRWSPLLVWGLLPLRALGGACCWSRRGALPLAVALRAGSAGCRWPTSPRSSLAAALGIWIADEIETRELDRRSSPRVSAAVDIVSVAAGPTKAHPRPGPGGGRLLHGRRDLVRLHATARRTRASGISDVIFFALYLGAARRFGLRVGLSAVAMVASFLATIAAGDLVDGAAGAAAAVGRLPGRQRATCSGASSRRTATGGDAAPASGRPCAVSVALEQRDRLDVVRLREHVDRGHAREAVAELRELARRCRPAWWGCRRRRRSGRRRAPPRAAAPCAPCPARGGSTTHDRRAARRRRARVGVQRRVRRELAAAGARRAA